MIQHTVTSEYAVIAIDSFGKKYFFEWKNCDVLRGKKRPTRNDLNSHILLICALLQILANQWKHKRTAYAVAGYI